MTTEELHAKYGEEQVLAADAALFKDFPRWTDYSKFKDVESKAQKVPRYLAETDESKRQIVAYIIVRDAYNRYFVTRRIGGDERLVGKLACIGGHMDGADESLSVTALREADEELYMSTLTSMYPIITKKGWIVCNDTPVDRVHVGCVFELQVLGDDIGVKETDKLEGVWMTRDELLASKDKCETWLSILLDESIIDGKRTANQLAYHTLMTYIRKNADYGNAFFAAYKRFGQLSAFVRMFDKVLRYKNLVGKQAQVKDEAVADTLEDLVDYAVMTAALQINVDKNDPKLKKLSPLEKHSALTTTMLYSLAINGIGDTAPFHDADALSHEFDEIVKIGAGNRQGRYQRLIRFAQAVMATVIHSNVDAAASDVLYGKKIVAADGTEVTGTMANNMGEEDAHE